MKKSVDTSQKTVFRQTRIKNYDKPRMVAGYVNKQLNKTSKERLMFIRKKYPAKPLDGIMVNKSVKG